ncbi:hypothetical protein N781_02815 [Pontibacillus halophilus JSM 076056 = DSM 19796]|uniref:Uncharacterized protein n=1 Tax=Pontibacillus halophilus JSM 076056 = DSM 19796 TaxID=1385510 RepID=A0A0A5I8B3_9BACI|nr:hypothetical protein [Pontibacillus halophilus]KGX92067.1 hypothetical protein N781_02815 [Pontibacillus halophilus JSM 076056 = DSM 19796]
MTFRVIGMYLADVKIQFSVNRKEQYFTNRTDAEAFREQIIKEDILPQYYELEIETLPAHAE